MRFAICNETFQDWPFTRAFEYVRKIGYRGIEFAPFTIGQSASDITVHRRSELRRQVAAAGLEVVGLHWLLAHTQGYHLTSPDADVRRATSGYLDELARLCRDLGGGVMVLGSPQQRNLLPGVTREQAHDYAVEVIQRVVPTLEECGVTLALEPLGPQEGNYLLTSTEAMTLLRRIDAPQVRLHLDVKAMATEAEAIPDIIRRCSGATVHFHANDSNRRGPGMGDIDFVPILQALWETGYGGWVSVEVFDYEPGVEALAGESIQYLQACERRIIKS